MKNKTINWFFLLIFVVISSPSYSLEIDRKVTKDTSGFWGSHYYIPRYSFIMVAGIALYEGTESRIGMTSWQAVEAGIISQLVTESVKKVTGRVRPRYTNSPSDWGEDGKSFPSGHVSGMTATVTPFILEYKETNPWVYLLWALPVHQMGGRIKAQAHWQSDVVVGALVGYASGYFTHKLKTPILLYFDEDKIFVGLKHNF